MNLAGKLVPFGARDVSMMMKRFYRAATLAAIGKPLQIVQMKDKMPHDSEILVEVASAGFNEADINMIDGSYHLKPNTPFVPGFELSGTILAAGKAVKRFKEGDRVIALRPDATGAFAERCMLTQSDIIMTIPYTLNFDKATCLPLSYGTAYMALQKMATERQGSSVLVLTSKGAVGLATVDLAQNVFKAQVFGASDSEDKLARLRATGLHSTFNWTDKRFGANVKKATFGEGVDLIIDTVGGETFARALNGLKIGGHVISVGFSSGIIPSISVLDLHRLQASVCGIWLGGRPQLEVENVLHTIVGLHDEGYLSVSVEKRYPLEQINECINDIKEEKVFGKVIIDMR